MGDCLQLCMEMGRQLPKGGAVLNLSCKKHLHPHNHIHFNLNMIRAELQYHSTSGLVFQNHDNAYYIMLIIFTEAVLLTVADALCCPEISMQLVIFVPYSYL